MPETKDLTFEALMRAGNTTAAGIASALDLERLSHQHTRVELWRERYNRASENLEWHLKEEKRLEARNRGEDPP